VCLVNANTTIYDALQKQSQLQSNVIIVKDDSKYKIVTDSDLRNRVLLQRMDLNQSIVEIASSGLISIDYNDFLFNALLMMTHNEIKRVVVTKEGEIVGVLEQIDLLSYFANHSHLIAVQIDKANSIEDLKYIQNDLGHLITSLKSRGVKVRYIAKLISTLNVKMYKKMFQISVDPSLQDKCALIVMGSEGRGEQIFKTDQDNALIIADGVDKELFTQPMMQLNEHLLALGFPRCKGDVMVSNPFWRRSVNEFKMFVKELCSSLNENDLQNLSILLDAKAVAGKLEFVDELKRYMYENFHARDDVLAHMAKAVLNFETPLSVFSSFVLEKKHDGKLDIKKGGLFALVHGIRTLALQYEIDAINSLERIKELNNKGVIDKNFAMELIESFDTLSTIRLEAMDTLSHDNYIDPKTLQKNQRDLLKDSFKIVNKFKKFMNFHFHLDMVV
jgi:CBS domain-containing protein